MPKILQLLQSLSPDERADLLGYLHIKPLKASEKLRQFAAALLAVLYDYETNNVAISKQKIWQTAFENVAYKNEQYLQYSSQLTKIINGFLVFLHYKNKGKNDNLTQQRDLLAALHERNLHDFVDENTAVFPQTKPVLNADDYTTHWQIAHTLDAHYEAILQRKPDTAQGIQAASDALDAHYIVHKLRYICAALNHNRILSTQIRLENSDFVLQFLAENPAILEQHPLINFYYYTTVLQFENIAINEIRTFWQQLKTYENDLSENDCDRIYSLLLNYCIKQANFKNKGFNALVFEIYAHLFDYNLLGIKGDSLSSNFKNAIKTGLPSLPTAAEIAAVETFFTQHHKGAEPLTLCYTQAYILFYKQDYAQTIFLLAKEKPSDPNDTFDFYCLRLRAHFLNGDTVAFESLSEAFKKALLRISDFPPATKQMYKNFNSLIFSIYTYKKQGKTGKQHLLIAKLNKVKAAENIANEDWLLAQIEALP